MIRFQRSVVDVGTRVIELDGEAQHLEPQAFDLLEYLLAHRDRVVPKLELLDEVWGHQFVSEAALTTRIKEVRRAVGDDGTRQDVIKTFRGRGYRFIAQIDEPDDDAETVVGVTSMATSLIGRDDDIEATIRRLEDSRLVTLVGPGGVGKTSLARDIARRCRERHSDGVVFIGLDSVRDADSVRHVLRRTIGLDEAGPTDADLIEAIADLDALIVLDNCEHVIVETARLVGAITATGGRVRVLATSRERLGLSIETVWPVDPLSEGTARRLLLDRARSALPTYEFPAESEATVAKLLNRLDRLPLAIEMAAARLPSVGLDELIAFLDDRLDLLRTLDRSADDRHRTIDELIQWSEELLDDDERDVLTCLSAFAGPAIASDIAVVAQRDSTELAIGSLAGCVDRSLVVVDTVRPPTSYRLLETVRARVEQRRTAAHDARHAHHIIDVATEMDRILRTPDEPTAARRLAALEADIRVAHTWAREHDPDRAGELTAALIHYAYERQWTEPITWADQLMKDADPDDPATCAAAAVCAADSANRGDFASAVDLAERATVSTDPRVLASAHDTLGNVGIYTGDLGTARHHMSVLRAIAEGEGDATLEANALTGEAMVLAYGGRADAALDHLERNDLTTSCSATGAAWIAYIEGDTLSALDRQDEAIEKYDHAMQLASSVGSRFVASVAELAALAARSRSGDLDEARAAFIPVLTHYRRVRSLTHAITALRNLVELLVRAGENETAIVLLGALSHPDVKATYGAESERLDEARSVVEARVDSETVEMWMANGASHDAIWAVDHAINILS